MIQSKVIQKLRWNQYWETVENKYIPLMVRSVIVNFPCEQNESPCVPELQCVYFHVSSILLHWTQKWAAKPPLLLTTSKKSTTKQLSGMEIIMWIPLLIFWFILSPECNYRQIDLKLRCFNYTVKGSDKDMVKEDGLIAHRIEMRYVG